MVAHGGTGLDQADRCGTFGIGGQAYPGRAATLRDRDCISGR